jgi:hypothetical protein
MKIITITDRLFQVEELFPQELVDKLLNRDWLSSPYQTKESGSDLFRRSLLLDTTLIEANTAIIELQPQIEDLCRVTFKIPAQVVSTQWWVDEPGFTVGLHTDGELPSTMQMYWVSPTIFLGTMFSHSSNYHESPYKTFIPIVNTGYIMLNGKNQDDSQPKLWHGMINPVPPGTFRVSSYTSFGQYTDK